MADDKIEVSYSERARKQLEELKKRSEKKPWGAHATIYNALKRDIAEILAVPDHAFARSSHLRKLPQTDFRGVYRVKVGERGRLFYIGDPQTKRIIVLYFADTRKAGDKKRDAYAELSRLIRSNEFDLLFKELGIEKPRG